MVAILTILGLIFLMIGTFALLLHSFCEDNYYRNAPAIRAITGKFEPYPRPIPV